MSSSFRRQIDDARLTSAPDDKPSSYRDALERAIGRLLKNERYRLGLRIAELERRLAELEERER